MRYKQRELVDPKKLLEAVDQITDITQAEDVSVALAGGFAMQVYGSNRFTKDIDVVTDSDTPLKGLPRGQRLSFGGEQTHAPNGVPVDVIRRDDDYADLYDEALDKAVDVKGIPMLVVAPEYLLAMKIAAARDKDELDVKFLIGSDEIDLKAARKIVKKHLGVFAAEELDRLVEEVEWQKTRKQ